MQPSRKFSLESYRKYKYCPVPGCPLRKPKKKLANHISMYHPEISKARQLRYLKEAKVAGSKLGQKQVPGPSQPRIEKYLGDSGGDHSPTPEAKGKGRKALGGKGKGRKGGGDERSY